jgi:hypothetical protein
MSCSVSDVLRAALNTVALQRRSRACSPRPTSPPGVLRRSSGKWTGQSPGLRAWRCKRNRIATRIPSVSAVLVLTRSSRCSSCRPLRASTAFVMRFRITCAGRALRPPSTTPADHQAAWNANWPTASVTVELACRSMAGSTSSSRATARMVDKLRDGGLNR